MSLPNPQQMAADLITEDTIDEYKRYDCTRYDRCLDVAVLRGWPQFHCNDCTTYEPLPDDHPSRRLFSSAGRKIWKRQP